MKKIYWIFLLQHHNTPHTTTLKIPYEAMFGRKGQDKSPMIDVRGSSINDSEMRDLDKINKEKGKVRANKERNAER